MQTEFTTANLHLPSAQYLNRTDYQMKCFRVDKRVLHQEQPRNAAEITAPIEVVAFAYAQKDNANGQLACRTALDVFQTSLLHTLQDKPIATVLAEVLQTTNQAMIDLARTLSAPIDNSVSLAIIVIEENKHLDKQNSNNNPSQYNVFACTIGDCIIEFQSKLQVRHDSNFLGEYHPNKSIETIVANPFSKAAFTGNKTIGIRYIPPDSRLVSAGEETQTQDTSKKNLLATKSNKHVPYVDIYVSSGKVMWDRRVKNIVQIFRTALFVLLFFVASTIIVLGLSSLMNNTSSPKEMLSWMKGKLGDFVAIAPFSLPGRAQKAESTPTHLPSQTPDDSLSPTGTSVASNTPAATATTTPTLALTPPIPSATVQPQAGSVGLCTDATQPTLVSPSTNNGFQPGIPINFQWRGALPEGTAFEIQFDGMGCTADDGFCGIMDANELTSRKLGRASGNFSYRAAPIPGNFGNFQWRVAIVIPDDPSTSAWEYISCKGSESRIITIAPGTVP